MHGSKTTQERRTQAAADDDHVDPDGSGSCGRASQASRHPWHRLANPREDDPDALRGRGAIGETMRRDAINVWMPAAVYARYSTDKQDARSTEDQVRRCRRFAESQGYKVVAVYEDHAVSGAHAVRAELQRMLADARRRGGSPFKAVLVDDQSR